MRKPQPGQGNYSHTSFNLLEFSLISLDFVASISNQPPTRELSISADIRIHHCILWEKAYWRVFSRRGKTDSIPIMLAQFNAASQRKLPRPGGCRILQTLRS